MEPTHKLLQRAVPGDRHRQEQGIEPRVVKALADVASGCQNRPRFVRWDRCQRLSHRLALLLANAALHDEDTLGNRDRLGSL
jgi:hypothetical protein